MNQLSELDVNSVSGGEYYTGDLVSGTIQVHFYNAFDAGLYCGLTAVSLFSGLPTPGYAVSACMGYYNIE
jgi:hypothetical protein